jgi:hypothetical protein
MQTRPTPPSLFTSISTLLHCCETWHVRAGEGRVIPNLPTEPETWAAIASMQSVLLTPLERRFGVVVLTYGFAGPELVKAIEERAAEGGWLPNISPRGDQHAGHERNRLGNRICKRDGIAVDLRVPGQDSLVVAQWVVDNLPFDRIYVYDSVRPFHLSWAPEPVAQVVRMVTTASGRLMPRVLPKGAPVVGNPA